MSKRITTQTDINDLELATNSLKQAGYTFSVKDARITITSGPLRGAVIDTSSGDVNHDDMYNPDKAVNAFKQVYGETKIRQEISKNGGEYVGDRIVHKNGDIEFLYQIG